MIIGPTHTCSHVHSCIGEQVLYGLSRSAGVQSAGDCVIHAHDGVAACLLAPIRESIGYELL